MNLITTFKEGQRGMNKGLPMGEGLKAISIHTGGIKRGKIYVVAAAPKGGKSTLVDSGFVIEPCVYVMDHNAKIRAQIEQVIKDTPPESVETVVEMLNEEILYYEIIYFSYEIDRVSKEFDFMAHFLERDHGVSKINLPPGKTFKDETYVPMSGSFLMGEDVYDQLNSQGEREVILVPESIQERMKLTYRDRIIPLFGEYDEKGDQIQKGMIFFLDTRDNPTGMRNTLISYAKTRGTIKYLETTIGVKTTKRMIGYTLHNPKLFTMVVTDHLRKVHKERNFSLKEAVDKFSEYSVELRNICNFSFAHIIHLNRSMSDVMRRKVDGDYIYPMSDDIKETGNLSEDANYIFTMFNPNDDKYNLKKHFGATIRSPSGGLLYPNMRTVHLVESRHCPAPEHFRVSMFGGTKRFEKLTVK